MSSGDAVAAAADKTCNTTKGGRDDGGKENILLPLRKAVQEQVSM